MSNGENAFAVLSKSTGTSEGAGEWFLVDQERINAFAEVTEDRQFIHVDPELSAQMSPTFIDCGAHQLLAMKVWARLVQPYSRRAAALLQRPLRRLAGDMAVLGKGEIFIGSAN